MPENWLSTSIEVEPYSQLARIYDHLMRHVNYGEWADYLVRLFSKADGPVIKIIDISCGTGSLLKELIDRGYSACGFDNSREMVNIAKKKLTDGRSAPDVWVGSMQDLSVATVVDAVVCTYDSLNYCETLEKCSSVFENVATLLRKGGVFIFDLSTHSNSKRYFRNYYDKDETEGYKYIRQSYYLRGKQINEFFIRPVSRRQKTFRELHCQQIYRIKDIMGALPLASFDVLGVYDSFTLRPGTEKSERVNFLLQRV